MCDVRRSHPIEKKGMRYNSTLFFEKRKKVCDIKHNGTWFEKNCAIIIKNRNESVLAIKVPCTIMNNIAKIVFNFLV